tara:strand:- start:8476 stop:8682 length:207 start_codon:yes stop_codon:yes gene_type:complete
MYQWIENLGIDLLQYNKIDKRKNKNKTRDYFMFLCFKVFVIAFILTIIYFYIDKYNTKGYFFISDKVN